MNKQVIVCFVSATLIFCLNSCKTNNEPINKTMPVYLPLTVGNYWIYQHFIVDSLGNELALNRYDSVVITQDTIINGKLFYEFGGKQNEAFFHQFIRDSAEYLVNSSGGKFFSSSNFSDIISERKDSLEFNRVKRLIISLNTKMESAPVQIITAAGVFNTLNASGLLTTYYYDSSATLTDSINTLQNTYYAENVGIVIQTYNFHNDIRSISEDLKKD